MSGTHTFQVDSLRVKCYGSRKEMGAGAAQDIRKKILALAKEQPAINVIFAAAPSQLEMLAVLAADRTIPWKKINAFHMDEYIGLPKDAPQRFGAFLHRYLFEKVPLRSVSYLNGSAEDMERECVRYAALLEQYPADLVCMGIGENGHIAFNDPPVADFNDPLSVKRVELDETCRKQQVHDGCFAHLKDVPRSALTLTVPALMRAPWLFCVVPAATKAHAVREMLQGPIAEACPASVLRNHTGASLYLDEDSAMLL